MFIDNFQKFKFLVQILEFLSSYSKPGGPPANLWSPPRGTRPPGWESLESLECSKLNELFHFRMRKVA